MTAAPAGFALVPPDIERLRHIDAQIWEDLAAALTEAKDGHHNAELDELDCVLLLDLVRLYRRAAAAPAVPPQGAAAALAQHAKCNPDALEQFEAAVRMHEREPTAWNSDKLTMRREALRRYIASQAAPAAPKGAEPQARMPRVMVSFQHNPIGELWLVDGEGKALGDTGPVRWPEAWLKPWTDALWLYKQRAAISTPSPAAPKGEAR